MERLNKISYDIIGCAFKVHTELGPGLLESTYETCLEFELLQMGYKFERQKPLPVIYKSVKLDVGYRLDFLIEDSVVVEIKSVEAIHPIYEAQLLTYLKLSGKKLGLLINFNEIDLKDGIMRRVM